MDRHEARPHGLVQRNEVDPGFPIPRGDMAQGHKLFVQT